MKTSLKAKALDLSTLWILLVILVFFGIFGNGFLTVSNVSTILNQASFLVLIGVSQMIAMLVGEINISIGACMALSTVVCGTWLSKKSDVFILLPILVVLCM